MIEREKFERWKSNHSVAFIFSINMLKQFHNNTNQTTIVTCSKAILWLMIALIRAGFQEKH